MTSKEKDNDKITKTTTPVEKELNADTVKSQLEGMVEYHNNLVAQKEKVLVDLNKIENLLSQSKGGIHTLQGLQNEYFATDDHSDNGSA
jgi:uncharacterized protein YpuA (DUF1002 family)